MSNDSTVKRLKRRLGANGPGLIVAVVAMLVALTGGAFAASGALTSKQKKEVKAIVKKEAKTIPGPAGAQGPAGAAGAKGDKGDPGTLGSPGAPGKSVKVTSLAAPECEGRTGALVKEEGAVSGAKVCKGEKGEEGSPWTDGGTLPPGATETGTWAFTGTAADNKIHVAISFPIPLAEELLEADVHFQTDAGFTTDCPGNAENPNPKQGELCVYTTPADFPEEVTFERISPLFGPPGEEKGASISGAILAFSKPTGNASGSGSFAVRAPEIP
jgi:hypothetical protein